MAAKTIGYGVATIVGIIALLIGLYGGYLIHPNTQVIEKTCPTCSVCPTPSEKIVEVPKEVIKQVIKEIPLDIKATYLDNAVDDFMADIEDLGLTECNDVEYDEDQIAIKKLYDGWNVELNDDKYSVTFSTKLKYLDSDVSEKCYNTFDVNVFYEPDEDPVVSILD